MRNKVKRINKPVWHFEVFSYFFKWSLQKIEDVGLRNMPEI